MTQTTADTRRFVGIPEAARDFGISRGKMYDLVYDGTIATVRIGRRRLIAREVLDQFAESLVAS